MGSLEGGSGVLNLQRGLTEWVCLSRENLDSSEQVAKKFACSLLFLYICYTMVHRITLNMLVESTAMSMCFV